MVQKQKISQENLSKVLHILKLIHQDGKLRKDIYSTFCKSYEKLNTGHTLFRKPCSDLLTKIIACHRYKEAVKLLWILTQDTSAYMNFIFKAGMIVLLNLEFDGKDEAVFKFLFHIQAFVLINKREVQLEYMMISLQNDIHNVQNKFKKLCQRITQRKDYLRKNEKIDSLFASYSALLDYMDYINTYYGDSNHLSQQDQVSAKILKFRTLSEIPGEWDIFIPKLIRMLEHGNKHAEIETILLQYVTKNPDNLNAYIYLLVYLNHCKQESENLIKYLEKLSEMCPSDVRVLWLIEVWLLKPFKGRRHISKCLYYIFIFLDYPANGKNFQAWKILLQILSSISRLKRSKVVMQNLWALRCKSWEWMYFNFLKISQQDLDDKLFPFKIACLSILNKEHVFISKTKRKFPEIVKVANSLRRQKYQNT